MKPTVHRGFPSLPNYSNIAIRVHYYGTRDPLIVNTAGISYSKQRGRRVMR